MRNNKTHLPFFEISVFRVYLRNHLSYNLFASLSEEISDGKKIQIRSHNQVIIFQKKGIYWKKSAIFHESKIQENNLNTNKFPTQKSSAVVQGRPYIPAR